MRGIRILPLENDIYSISAVFEYDESGEGGWFFRGACIGIGDIDADETATAKRLMDFEIAMALRQLNEEGPPQPPTKTVEDEMVEAMKHIDVGEDNLRSRMRKYNEEFLMLGSVIVEEFGLKMMIRHVGNGYKAEVDCENDLKEKIFLKQGKREEVEGGKDMEKVFLECGKDKMKVIPMVIKQAENFSLWIATL